MPVFGFGGAGPSAANSSTCWANFNQKSAIVTQYSWEAPVMASRASIRESAAFLRYCSDRSNATAPLASEAKYITRERWIRSGKNVQKCTQGKVPSHRNYFHLLKSNQVNDVNGMNGMRHRFGGISHCRQWGDFVLRILVVMPGTAVGLAFPSASIISSRSPSFTRMMGATPSGNIAGSCGRLPVLSRVTRNRSRIAFWLVVIE